MSKPTSSGKRKPVRIRIRYDEVARSRVKPRAPAPERPGGPIDAFRALAEAMYDAMLVADPGGRILDANPRAEEMLKYPRDELLRKTLPEALAGFDKDMFDKILPNLRRGRFALVQAWCERGGETDRFPAEVAVSLLGRRPERLCLFLRDITLRKRTETLLQTGYNAMQNAASGIAVLDRDGRIEYANPAAHRLWGYERRDSLVGRSLFDLMREGPDAEALLKAAARGDSVWQKAVSARRRDGSEFDAKITAACNRNAQGDPIGAVVSILDVTAERAAEEAVRQAERQGAMLASLGAACHHLAQPATVLIGNLGLLEQMGEELTEEARERLHLALESADGLARILHRLNEVNEYRTTTYLPSGPVDAPENRLLQI